MRMRLRVGARNDEGSGPQWRRVGARNGEGSGPQWRRVGARNDTIRHPGLDPGSNSLVCMDELASFPGNMLTFAR